MVNCPSEFQPHINVSYPPNNTLIFEEWFSRNYTSDVSDREYLGVHFTSYLVNHDYAKRPEDVPRLQAFVDGLDRSRRYFVLVQYDLGCVVDFKDLDVLQFNMSDNNGYPLPLICMPHPYRFDGKRKEYFANFIGGITHPIRHHAEQLVGKEAYYIAYGNHSIERYCEVISKSIFTLCYRGFGKNSFRIQEALQYNSIPVYISDEIINAHNVPFSEYGVVIDAKDAHRTDEILRSLDTIDIVQKQDMLKSVFQKLYTYESNRFLILDYLEREYLKERSERA
jgi:hypothetical protein